MIDQIIRDSPQIARFRKEIRNIRIATGKTTIDLMPAVKFSFRPIFYTFPMKGRVLPCLRFFTPRLAACIDALRRLDFLHTNTTNTRFIYNTRIHISPILLY
jgi:hypothetical protein